MTGGYTRTGKAQGGAWASQAGAAFSNPFASELGFRPIADGGEAAQPPWLVTSREKANKAIGKIFIGFWHLLCKCCLYANDRFKRIKLQAGAVLQKVASAGTMVVTRDGRPMAILTPTSPESLVEDLQEIAFSKARRAVRNLRASAAEAGVDSLSPEEIEKEIQAVRKGAQ
ncbi:MAG: hypothetical protein ACKOEZ_08605 [Spartobacteria bacterium]